MSTFSYTMTIKAPTGTASETIEALVDTGSTFMTVPAEVLERLGVMAHRVVRLRLAHGRTDERRVGRVFARLNGLEEEILCVFGGPQDIPTIGAHTLEAFLLGVDRLRKRLVPVDALWV